MLRKLKSKDKSNFNHFALENNISKYLFLDFIKQKKLAFISEENDIINGLLFIEKTDDNYLQIVTKSKKVANNLLKILFWNWSKEIYSKIEVSNKLGFILKENGFRIVSKSGSIFLLHYNPQNKRKHYGNRKHR